MDHSCAPNAAVAFDGLDIVVRSLTDRDELDFGSTFIRESPGEQSSFGGRTEGT